MDKKEYLELARKKGWDKKIPRLKDGTYDCDVFGGDNVKFDFSFFISGNLYLGDNAHIILVAAGGSITLGDYSTSGIAVNAGGDIIFGDYAYTDDVNAGGNIIFGDYAKISDVFTVVGDIFFGDYAYVGDVTAMVRSIFFGDYAQTSDVDAGGNITFGNNAHPLNVTASVKVTFADD